MGCVLFVFVCVEESIGLCSPNRFWFFVWLFVVMVCGWLGTRTGDGGVRRCALDDAGSSGGSFDQVQAFIMKCWPELKDITFTTKYKVLFHRPSLVSSQQSDVM